MAVIDEIAAERRRQIDVEGWTSGHDDRHVGGELARSATAYAWFGALSDAERRGFSEFDGSPHGFFLDYLWPKLWSRAWWKPKDRRRDLIKAGALIVAEIERLDRAAPAPEQGGG